MAKTKALISFAVTAKLICVFVFAYAKAGFLTTWLKLSLLMVALLIIQLFLAETVTKSKIQEVEMVSEAETSVVKTPPRVSLSKVTTRGNSDTLASFAPDDTTFSAPATLASFAPDDTTFSAPANVHSFVFKPLSPASAATFLFPNQDPSACASFLETKPNRLVNFLTGIHRMSF